MNREEGVGYVKFVGESVHDGSIGADAAGRALLAVDELLKFFNRQQSRDLASTDYEINVRTKQGSWEVVVLGGIGIFAASYIKKAAEKMAERDFTDTGLKDVLRRSVDALKWLARVLKHTKGSLDFSSTSISWRANEGKVGIPNQEGEVIYVPLEYLKWYLSLPSQPLRKLTQPVEKERKLVIASKIDGATDEVEVSAPDKIYMGHQLESQDEDFLFPELEHGQQIQLEGKLTRGNENTNSLGLEYAGHVLNCVPEAGSIVQFKSALFLRCRVFATVSRLAKQHVEVERRPTLIVSHVIPLQSDDQLTLFDQ